MNAPAAASFPRPAATGFASIAAFFALAYALTWIFWIPAGLHETGRIALPVPGWLFELLGGLGPLVAAVVVSALREGRAGVAGLFRQALRWRVGAWPYALVFLGLPLLGLPDLVVHVASGHALQLHDLGPLLIVYPIHFLFVALVGGGLDEELGWRGFALPRLQAHLHPTAANVLLGVLWAGWHLPLWFVPGSFQSQQSFGLYLVGMVASAVLLGWLYNGTGGSLLLVILAHASMDATDNLRTNLLGALAPEQATTYHLIRTALEVAVAVAIVAATRGRLGLDGGRAREGTSA